MPKVEVKDIIMFLKIFGISSLFFIAGIIICFIGEKTLGISWPAYVIVSAMLIGSGIIVLIIKCKVKMQVGFLTLIKSIIYFLLKIATIFSKKIFFFKLCSYFSITKNDFC